MNKGTGEDFIYEKDETMTGGTEPKTKNKLVTINFPSDFLDSEKYNDDRYVSSKSTSHGYGTSVWVPENNDSEPSVVIDLGTDMDVTDFKVFGGVMQDKSEPEKKYRQVYRKMD